MPAGEVGLTLRAGDVPPGKGSVEGRRGKGATKETGSSDLEKGWSYGEREPQSRAVGEEGFAGSGWDGGRATEDEARQRAGHRSATRLARVRIASLG